VLQAMIHAYVDDSGDDRKQEYAVCGAVWGDVFTMKVCEAQWGHETSSLQKPFRSTDCECQQGQFKTWEKADCDNLMSRLVGVLLDNRIALLGSTVDIQLFKKVFPDAKKDDPIRLATRHLLVSMSKIARHMNEHVHVWFESGPEDADILRAYNEVRSFQFPNPSERRRLSSLTFGDKTLLPLQAADFAARESFKAAQNFRKRPTRKPLSRLWGHAMMQCFDEECLRKLKAGGDPLSIGAINGMGTDCHPAMVEATPFSVKRIPI